jgi:flagellar biosynthesis/type III secretory pathway ATPase
MGVLPAIDITQSISRLFTKLQDPSYRRSAQIVTHAMFRLMKEREIVLLGGSPDPELKRILSNQQRLLNLISQSLQDLCSHEESERLVVQLSSELTGGDRGLA